MEAQTLVYLIYMLAAASAVLAIEAVYVSFASRRAKVGAINRRLKRLSQEGHAEEALQSLLRERGLDEKGNFASNIIWLNRLYTQSGITGSPLAFASMFFAFGIAVALALRLLFGVATPPAIMTFLVIAVGAPLFFLRRARNRRISRFAAQLPDALDMIVRSLRAGHPTSVAVGLVAREIPDPLGTEFGIVADEITFGLGLEQAVKKLSERVGFEGLHLLAVSLSIQSRTGGNLTEILANLSKTLRERQKMKLKIRALSAEGRWSAILLSAFPFVMFIILQIGAPGYYGKVWGDPLVFPVFLLFGGLALIGDYIMYRMVNFDF